MPDLLRGFRLTTLRPALSPALLLTGAGGGALAPRRVSAHAFAAGSDSYDAFTEGAGSVLLYPEVLLPLVALALLAVLHRAEALPRVMPLLLAGAGLALLLAPRLGEGTAPAAMGFGIVLAALAALVPNRLPRPALAVLALTTGGLSLSSLLHGQDLSALPVTLLLGVLFAALLLPMTVGGAARLVMQGTGGWRAIALRVAASWIAAILLLMLAFTLRG
ncbi:hypothetical protein [Pseudooceanicola aestuarii]|uniref:hypothetical protein n=1 Tax=Pseudooceanicola aestuarii TaxID=2697319 RepID=UPI0019539C39|nr:hypothetical protein [Pseudooceanicola aestuarii]